MKVKDPYSRLMGANFVGPPRPPAPEDGYESLIEETAQKYPEADAGTLRRLLTTESGGDRWAESPKGAKGIAQLMDGTAKDYGVDDPYNPEQAIPAAGHYLSDLTKRFGGDKEKAAAAYNFGPGNVEKGRAYPAETRDYVRKVANVPGGESAATRGPADESSPEPMQTSTQANPEPIKAAVPGVRGIDNAKGVDRDQLFASWDGQMARDEALDRAIKAYDAKGDLSLTELSTKNKLVHARRALLQRMAKTRDDEELGPAYEEWYNARYNVQPEAKPTDSGPGILDRILKGAADTGSMAVKQPMRSLANVGHGIEEIASLPGRAIESLVMGDKGEFPFMSPKRWLRERLQESKGKDIVAGVPADSSGPEVMRAVGGVAAPLPGPKLYKGEAVKNFLKGGAFGAGANVVDRVAEGEPITPEGLTTSAGISGLLTALFGRFAPKRVPEAKPTPGVDLSGTNPNGPAPMPPKRPPLAIEDYSNIQPGEVRNGKVYGAPPPKALPAPAGPLPEGSKEITVPDAWKSRIEAAWRSPDGEIFAKLPGGEIKSAGKPGGTQMSTPDQPMQERGTIQRILDMRRNERAKTPVESTPPPNAGGLREIIARHKDVATTKAGEAAMGDGSVPYPGSMYGMPGVKQPEAPITGEVVKEVRRIPKPGAKGEIEARISTPTPKLEPKVPLPKKADKVDDIIMKLDEAKTAAEAEAELGAVLRGEKSVESIPVGRDPKSVPPVVAKASEPITPEVKPTAKPVVESLATVEKPAVVETPAAKAKPTVEDVRAALLAKKSAPAESSGKIAETLPFEERIKSGAAVEFTQPGTIKTKGTGTVTGYKKDPVTGDTFAEVKTSTGRTEFVGDTNDVRVRKGPDLKERVLPQKRVEDFIKEEGFKVREREPFPGQREYDIVDSKSGNVIARGDRSQLTEGLAERAKAKGFKLHSFPGDVGTFKETFDDVLRKVGAKVPEDVGITNEKPTRSFANATLQAFETPDFLFRKYKPARDLVSDAGWAERNVERRVKDLIYKEGPDGFTKTKLHTYFEMPASDRAQVDKVLVYGDRRGVEFTPEALTKSGLTEAQAHAYQGVREALDNVRSWAIGEADDLGKIKGYIPRVWHGNSEIFVNGTKHIKADGSSTFATQREAQAAAFKIKQADPGAKVDIKFFADPEYFGGRGFQDAQLVNRLKKNLDAMGSHAAADIDKAYAMGRDVKGFAKHLEMRKGETGYQVEGLDKVLFNYFHQAAKHVEMSKLREAAKQMLKEHGNEMTTGQVNYLKNYVERVAGRPTWDQIAIHNWIGDTPLGRWIDPISGNKFLKNTRQLVTHLTLGMGNLSWAALNVDTVIRHVWPALQREGKDLGIVASEKYLGSAVAQFFKDKALRQKLAHYGVIDIQHMSEVLPSVGHKFGKGEWTPGRISMALGTATEEFVRGVSAIARFNMAKAQGMDEKAAMVAAARFVDATSGRYTKAGKPAAYQGAIGETVGMFKTYMSVFMQNGFQAGAGAFKDPGTLIRYMMATLGVSGLAGLPFTDDVDEFITRNWGWSPMESLQKHLPEAAMTGIMSVFPGMMGHPGLNMDLSHKAGMPDVIPNDTKSILGPVIGRFATTISDLMQGEWQQAAEDLLLPNSLKGIVSVAKGWESGTSVGRNDKPLSKLEPEAQVVKSLGFPPAQEQKDVRQYQRLENKKAYLQETLRHLAHKQVSGNASESDQARFRELGGTRRLLKNERARETQTLRERQMKHLPKILRRQARSEEDY